jgi:excisionase family DNA binding protein
VGPAVRRLHPQVPTKRFVGLSAVPTGRTPGVPPHDRKHRNPARVRAELRDAYRTVAEAHPSGAPIAITIVREDLLALLGDPVPPRDESESFLTVDQVAQRLKVNKQTVYRRIKEKRLVASRIGRNVRVAESSLAKFIDRSRRGS